jgi:hypothetical protein
MTLIQPPDIPLKIKISNKPLIKDTVLSNTISNIESIDEHQEIAQNIGKRNHRLLPLQTKPHEINSQTSF